MFDLIVLFAVKDLLSIVGAGKQKVDANVGGLILCLDSDTVESLNKYVG